MEERWAKIDGFGGRYEVSSEGSVRNRLGIPIPQRIVFSADKRPKAIVYLGQEKKHKLALHRLVAAAFLPPVQGKANIAHINGDPSDCRACNLEWESYYHPPVQKAEEQWKPCPGFEGLYEVSSEGSVRNASSHRPLRPFFKEGAPPVMVSLSRDRHKTAVRIARLVAKAFLPPTEPPRIYVGFLNGDPTDCRAVNLEWRTRKSAKGGY